MLLEILIPSIPSRRAKLEALRDELTRQKNELSSVTVLVTPSFIDGGMSIGEKRQRLLEMSEAKYICFLDDDDWIAPNYIETLLKLCEEDKDVCTFRSLYTDDNMWSILDLSLKYRKNEQVSCERIIKRTAWHVCPIRRSIAIEHKFNPDLNHNEDWDWMIRVIRDLKTEAHSNTVIHNYRHSSKNSEADKIWNM